MVIAPTIRYCCLWNSIKFFVSIWHRLYNDTFDIYIYMQFSHKQQLTNGTFSDNFGEDLSIRFFWQDYAQGEHAGGPTAAAASVSEVGAVMGRPEDQLKNLGMGIVCTQIWAIQINVLFFFVENLNSTRKDSRIVWPGADGGGMKLLRFTLQWRA